MIDIVLNGVTHAIRPNLTIASLLKELNLQDQRIAIELNGLIVSRTEHKNTLILSGDKLEIIKAIGGG